MDQTVHMSTSTCQHLFREMACLRCYHHRSSPRHALVSEHVFAPPTVALSQFRTISLICLSEAYSSQWSVDRFQCPQACPTAPTVRTWKESPSSTSGGHRPRIGLPGRPSLELEIKRDLRLGLGAGHGSVLGPRYRLVLGSR
jgi:hypothetical protein